MHWVIMHQLTIVIHIFHISFYSWKDSVVRGNHYLQQYKSNIPDVDNTVQ